MRHHWPFTGYLIATALASPRFLPTPDDMATQLMPSGNDGATEKDFSQTGSPTPNLYPIPPPSPDMPAPSYQNPPAPSSGSPSQPVGPPPKGGSATANAVATSVAGGNAVANADALSKGGNAVATANATSIPVAAPGSPFSAGQLPSTGAPSFGGPPSLPVPGNDDFASGPPSSSSPATESDDKSNEQDDSAVNNEDMNGPSQPTASSPTGDYGAPPDTDASSSPQSPPSSPQPPGGLTPPVCTCIPGTPAVPGGAGTPNQDSELEIPEKLPEPTAEIWPAIPKGGPPKDTISIYTTQPPEGDKIPTKVVTKFGTWLCEPSKDSSDVNHIKTAEEILKKKGDSVVTQDIPSEVPCDIEVQHKEAGGSICGKYGGTIPKEWFLFGMRVIRDKCSTQVTPFDEAEKAGGLFMLWEIPGNKIAVH